MAFIRFLTLEAQESDAAGEADADVGRHRHAIVRPPLTDSVWPVM